jgi:tetratricopeptide (TPR) repeat protein
MINLKSGRFVLGALALLLPFAAGSSLHAQGSAPRVVTHPEDPLTHDPLRPNAHDYEIEQQNALIGKEVERALRDGNEATDAKPPRYADAERSYREALKFNPKEARAYLGLGRLYAAQDRADDSLAAFKKVIELKPKMAEAYFNMGVIYFAVGKKDAALEQYRVLQTLNKDLARRLDKLINR